MPLSTKSFRKILLTKGKNVEGPIHHRTCPFANFHEILGIVLTATTPFKRIFRPPSCQTDKCFHTLRPLSATRVPRSDDRQRKKERIAKFLSSLRRPIRPTKRRLSLSLSFSSSLSRLDKTTSPILSKTQCVHYVGNRLYKMWLSRATKVLEKNSCATTNTYNKFVLRSIIISSQELRPERRERERKR